MKNYKEKAKSLKGKLADKKEFQIRDFLKAYLLQAAWVDALHEARLFLEENWESERLEDLEEELKERAPADLSPEEREDWRVDLLAELVYEGANLDQREEWYRQAKRGEKLDGIA